MKKIASYIFCLTIALVFVQCKSSKVMTTTLTPPKKAKNMKAQDCGTNKQWVSGHWELKKEEFVWKDGKCVGKKEGMIYLPARWADDRQGNYTFKPGGWKKVGKKLEVKQ